MTICFTGVVLSASNLSWTHSRWKGSDKGRQTVFFTPLNPFGGMELAAHIGFVDRSCEKAICASRAFDMDETVFLRNLRSARRGAEAGPSGMTTEHLRPSLHDVSTQRLIFKLGERLGRGWVPHNVVEMIKALSKPGDVIRRVVLRSLTQQSGAAVKQATSPFQYAEVVPLMRLLFSVGQH